MGENVQNQSKSVKMVKIMKKQSEWLKLENRWRTRLDGQNEIGQDERKSAAIGEDNRNEGKLA